MCIRRSCLVVPNWKITSDKSKNSSMELTVKFWLRSLWFRSLWFRSLWFRSCWFCSLWFQSLYFVKNSYFFTQYSQFGNSLGSLNSHVSWNIRFSDVQMWEWLCWCLDFCSCITITFWNILIWGLHQVNFRCLPTQLLKNLKLKRLFSCSKVPLNLCCFWTVSQVWGLKMEVWNPNVKHQRWHLPPTSCLNSLFSRSTHAHGTN